MKEQIKLFVETSCDYSKLLSLMLSQAGLPENPQQVVGRMFRFGYLAGCYGRQVLVGNVVGIRANENSEKANECIELLISNSHCHNYNRVYSLRYCYKDAQWNIVHDGGCENPMPDHYIPGELQIW
jgi:hypothetical protein